jgi:ribosomal-protein-alanine N-acetyltransferase
MNQQPEASYYSQQTKRLNFVKITKDHCALWEPFFNDNPTLRFVGLENATTSPIETAKGWLEKQIERMNSREFGQLAVYEKESNQFVGVGGIITREINGKPEYEITYSLLSQFWGKGYATELAMHFKDYAFEQMKIKSVISIIHIENEASINVALKNGMKKDIELTFMDMPVCIYRA